MKQDNEKRETLPKDLNFQARWICVYDGTHPANLAYHRTSMTGCDPIAAATTAAPAVTLPIGTALLLPLELPGKV